MDLETKRLLLRPFTMDDLDQFAHLVADPEVMRFSLKGPLSREEAKEYLQNRILDHYAKYGFGLLAIIHKETNQLIGFAGLICQCIDEENLVELGYRLDPRYWKQGLATEAAQEIVKYAFTHLGLDRLICIIDPKNVASLSVAIRLGMGLWKKTLFHGFSVEVYLLNKVVVSDANTSWETVFLQQKEILAGAFQGLPIDFFHIGSTSIPDCEAKPILDILGITTDIFAVDEYNDALYLLGFTELGEFGMPGRRFFKRERSPKINLHIFAKSDPEGERHLRFSSYMRNHPDKVKQYSKLKKELANQFPHDIHQYTLAKSHFIKQIDLEAALSSPTKNPPSIYPPQKSKWTKAEILYAMHVNMHLQMTCFAKYIPSMEYVWQKDATVICSSINDDMFNYVLFSRIEEKNISKRIAEISDIFEKKGLPFSWWVSLLDKPSSLEHHLFSEGFQKKEVNTGMYKHLESMSLPQRTRSITIERVESLTDLEKFMNVITAVGGPPDGFKMIHSQVPAILYTGDSSLEFYIGYIEGKAVVTGLLVTHLGVAGIYYIATIPTERKKGYATAMMDHLLQRASQKGYTVATLQASEEGSHVYEKIGFQSCCKLTEYSRKKT